MQRDEDFEGRAPASSASSSATTWARARLASGSTTWSATQLVRGETDLYELGRSATGVDHEQLAIVYEDDQLARTLIKRT